MSNNDISQAILRLFDKHRIVFWYDSESNLREDFENLSLKSLSVDEESSITKLEIKNNEFGIKYTILRENPKQRFLLYQEGAKPRDEDNWLLDVLLAHTEFHADKTSFILFELGLTNEYTDIVRNHAKFFQSEKRLKAFKAVLSKNVTESSNYYTNSALCLTMLAVCLKSDVSIDSIVEYLLKELAEDDMALAKSMKLIQDYKLDSILWKELKRQYGYETEPPSFEDFAIKIFKFCSDCVFQEEPPINNNMTVFINRFKNNRLFSETFAILSEKYAEVLNIENLTSACSYNNLLQFDYFEAFEKKLLFELIQHLLKRTESFKEIQNIISQRRDSFWYTKYQNLYEAIHYSSKFFENLQTINISVGSVQGAVEEYAKSWFKIDQYYRKSVYHINLFGKKTIVEGLLSEIEKHYSNSFLFKLGNNFQEAIDGCVNWNFPMLNMQRHFYEKEIKPYSLKGSKICVLISDALRYEIAEELHGLILRENRFNSNIKPMLGQIPSYTQLGMAALLPNKNLSIAPDTSGIIFVDGVSSQGTENRSKILQRTKELSVAITAEAFSVMKAKEKRDFVSGKEIIYIYHNTIDAIADKRDTEYNTFDAVEKTLQELMELIKSLTSANINNLIITADHGFIYQNNEIEETDFSSEQVDGENILYRNRRFVVGENLIEVQGLKKFTAKDLGIADEDSKIEVQIPKSINRLRLKGSGSRFVHGGASLQEIVIPVLSINKRRQDDTSLVDIDIISPTQNSPISSGQFMLLLYQKDVITAKIKSRTLRIALYGKDGELLSDIQEKIFDEKSNDPRDREMKLRFVLSQKANDFNNQEVFLRLEEQYGATSIKSVYKSVPYVIRRSFTSDFDF